MSLAFLLAAAADVHVIFAMLIVGLIFVGVVALGETAEWLHRRRHSRR